MKRETEDALISILGWASITVAILFIILGSLTLMTTAVILIAAFLYKVDSKTYES